MIPGVCLEFEVGNWRSRIRQPWTKRDLEKVGRKPARQYLACVRANVSKAQVDEVQVTDRLHHGPISKCHHDSNTSSPVSCKRRLACHKMINPSEPAPGAQDVRLCVAQQNTGRAQVHRFQIRLCADVVQQRHSRLLCFVALPLQRDSPASSQCLVPSWHSYKTTEGEKGRK